jgi:hypothetical protein
MELTDLGEKVCVAVNYTNDEICKTSTCGRGTTFYKSLTKNSSDYSKKRIVLNFGVN